MDEIKEELNNKGKMPGEKNSKKLL